MLGIEETMRSMLETTFRKVVREEFSAVRLSLAAPEPKKVDTAILEPTFTTSQIAAHLKVDDSTVRSWLNQGRMQGDKSSGKWLVTAAQLATFKTSERRTGRSAPANTDEEAARLLGSILED